MCEGGSFSGTELKDDYDRKKQDTIHKSPAPHILGKICSGSDAQGSCQTHEIGCSIPSQINRMCNRTITRLTVRYK